MISFNEQDVNMRAISDKARLFNLTGLYGYRIFGLRQENRPPIWVSYPDKMSLKFKTDTLIIQEFFRQQGLQVCISQYQKQNNQVVKIGLRHDVRKHIEISSAIIQTIIYYLEKRLKLDKQFRIKIPKFKHMSEQEIKKGELFVG